MYSAARRAFSTSKEYGKKAARVGKVLIVTAGATHCIVEYGFDVSTTIGASMEPIFSAQGDIILYDRFSHRVWGVQRGQVIICISPQDPETRLCKRVIGVPHDLVECDGKRFEVPINHLWLQGDNKMMSNDSRNYGHVPIGLVQGTVRWKMWPWHNSGWVETIEPKDFITREQTRNAHHFFVRNGTHTNANAE